MARENGQRQRNCLPDTLLWPGKMDNGNAIACPTCFYGPGKWATATQLLVRHAFMARENGQRQRNCLPDTLLWIGKMDTWQLYHVRGNNTLVWTTVMDNCNAIWCHIRFLWIIVGYPAMHRHHMNTIL
jgi:hypothetical protein